MKFIHVNFLWLFSFLPLVLFLIFYSTQKRKKLVLSFVSHENLRKLSTFDFRKKRIFSNIIAVLAFSLLIVSMAGPVTGYREENIKRRGVDIVFVLDASKSMLAEDIKPSRIKRAEFEILNLVEHLKGDRAGLIVFAGEAFVQSPLTLDNRGFKLLLDAVDPLFFPVGGTDLSKALKKAKEAFGDENDRSKVIILLSDGGKNHGEDPVKTASDIGIPVFSIGIGTKTGAPIYIPDKGFIRDQSGKTVIAKLESHMMERLSKASGGEYTDSENGFDLVSIYENKIRKKMELKEFSDSNIKIEKNSFHYFLFPAFVFIFIYFLLNLERKSFLTLFILIAIFHPCFSYAENLNEKAKELYEAKKFDKAFDIWTKIQTENPEDLNLYYNIANSAYKRGDLETAEKGYSHVLKKEAGKKNDLWHRSMYNLGNVNLLKKNYDMAIRNYKEVLESFKDDEDAKNNLELAEKLKKEEEKNRDQGKKGKDKDKKSGEGKNSSEKKSGGEKNPDQNKSAQKNLDQNKDDQGKNKGNSQNSDGKKSRQDGHGKSDDKNKSGQPDKPDNSDKLNQPKQPKKSDQSNQSGSHKNNDKDGKKHIPDEKAESPNKENDQKRETGGIAKEEKNGDKKGKPLPYKLGKPSGSTAFDMVKDKPLGLIPYYKKYRVEEDW